jgi:hypothetical protein
MKTNKVLLLSLVVILFCIVGSAGGTYYVMNNIRKDMVHDLGVFYGEQIRNLTSSVYFYKYDVIELHEELNITNDQLTDIKEDLFQVNQSLQENSSELEKLKSGDKFELHDPTYNEVYNFIASDKTNEKTYVEDVFDCEHFSQMINNNAENLGIKCAIVVVYFQETNTGHMIVGFNTIDNGMVYIEPQTDEWVENLVAGNEYWTDCVVPGDGYYYQDVSNDTVKEVLVFW